MLLTDPVVVTELIKEEEMKVKSLVDKYSNKMKKIHVSTSVFTGAAQYFCFIFF